VSYTGTVKNGVVVLPADVHLPEGTEVKVEASDAPENEAVEALLKLAKPRPHWPSDYALNHAHYRHGHPAKKP
jgi:hypothetical protein